MIKRRELLSALGLSFVTAPLTSLAQQQNKVWRIGYLSGGSRPADGLPPGALRQGLAELGYVEGRNVAYEGRWGEGKAASLRGLVAELVRLRVDAIVVVGGSASEAAKNATSTIPIILAGGGDAVRSGLVASLSHPGGNLTGISDLDIELSAKRLEILIEMVPNAARMAVLWNADDFAMTLRYREIAKAASDRRVAVQAVGVREPEDFEVAFAAMTRERPDALFLVADALTGLNRKRVIEFAAAQRIPAMYEFDFVVRDGGLISYGPRIDDNLRRVAYYLDRILKGAKPADLPMEQPTRFYLFVNLKTAKALGIKIPQSILLRADIVTE